ncbi:hypothetical protein AA3990_2033 [Gluconobacter roseus NBRC 3990]|nr:hypothetical protein AA3990_2033 [Gluconobacter roseus NBRC 3990]
MKGLSIDLPSMRNITWDNPETCPHLGREKNFILGRFRVEHSGIHLPPVPVYIAPDTRECRTDQCGPKIRCRLKQPIYEPVFTLLEFMKRECRTPKKL